MPDSFKIDAHVHVFTSDMPLIDNPRHAPNYSFTHQELIATLDENGIDRAVIAAASPWGDYNDYILAALRAHRARLRGTAIFRRPMERFALEAMGRDGFVGVRLPFIGLPRTSRHQHVRLSRAVSPPRRSRLARSSPCRGRGPAENPADTGSLRRQDRGRSSRPSRSEVRHQQRRFQGVAALDRQGPHLGQDVRWLPARAAGEGICARASARRRPRSAGVGERLPVRRP